MFNTFKQVEDHYNSIKVMVSKNHPREQDLRPIGPRRFKWERIEKLDDDTYAFWPGHTDGDDLFTQAGDRSFTKAEKIALAPVLWQRKGRREFVKVRNSTYGYATGYYKFLKAYLPTALPFGIKNGAHYVTCGGVDFYAKHPKDASKVRIEDMQTSWRKIRGVFQAEGMGDGALVFERKGDKFVPTAETKKRAVRVAKRVDMKLKAEFQTHINELRDWIFAIAPLIPSEGKEATEFRNEHHKRVVARIARRHSGQKFASWSCPVRAYPLIDRRDAVKDPDHPMRMVIAYELKRELFLNPNDRDYDRATRQWYRFEPDRKTAMDRFNRYINRALELTESKELPHDEK